MWLSARALISEGVGFWIEIGIPTLGEMLGEIGATLLPSGDETGLTGLSDVRLTLLSWER
jgi:hypothetical protein